MTTGFNKFIVIQEYKERLQASEEEEQCLLQALESKQKMEHARDAQISHLKTTWELQEKSMLSKHTSFDLSLNNYCVDYNNESLKAIKAEKQCLLQVLELRQKMERARDAEISSLKTSNEVLLKKCE